MGGVIALLAWCVLPGAGGGGGIEVVADGPVERQPGTVLISDRGFEVRLGALLDLELASRNPLLFGLPHARLRTEAYVDTQVPVGMVLELEASPFVDPSSNLDGPGLLRDAVLVLGIGNRRLLDLGQIQIGQQRVPSTSYSLLPPERWRFTRRPFAEEDRLPGRDLGLVYHMDYASHGVPLAVWLGSFSGAGPNRVEAPVAPVLSGRLVVGRPWQPGRGVAGQVGVGLVARRGHARYPYLVALDFGAQVKRFDGEISAIVGQDLGTGGVESAFRAEGGFELLADFMELRLRYEVDSLAAGPLRRRLSTAAILTYLDDAFVVLCDVTVPLGGAWARETELALAFRIWW